MRPLVLLTEDGAEGEFKVEACDFGAGVDVRQVGVGHVAEIAGEAGLVVKAPAGLERGAEFEGAAHVFAVALVVVARGEVGGQEGVFAHEHVEDETAEAVELGPRGCFDAREGVDLEPAGGGCVRRQERQAPAMFEAEVHGLKTRIVRHDVERAHADGDQVGNIVTVDGRGRGCGRGVLCVCGEGEEGERQEQQGARDFHREETPRGLGKVDSCLAIFLNKSMEIFGLTLYRR